MDSIFDECEKWVKLSLEEKYQQCNEQGDMRYVVICRLLEYMLRIQQEAVDRPMPNGMIAISLQDLKTFNYMVNTLVIDGIYPCLTPGVNVPLKYRTKQEPPKQDPDVNMPLLRKIVDALCNLLTTQGDVRDVLLRGAYTADFICAALQLPERDQFQTIKGQIQTYDLYGCFTTLLRPEAPQWFKAVVSRQLALLPTERRNGVRALIEFVSGLRTQEQISLTSLERAVQVLNTVPRGVDDEIEYSGKIANQLVTILGFSAQTGPAATLKSATVHVINALNERLKTQLHLALTNRLTTPQDEKSLSEGLNALATLSISSEIELKLAVPIWSLLCYYQQTKRSMDQVKGLLVSLLQKDDGSRTDQVVQRLLVSGVGGYSFGAGNDGGVEIRPDEFVDSSLDIFEMLDKRVELFVSIVKNLDEQVVSSLFVRIMRRWLAGSEDDDFTQMLVDVKILEQLAQDKDKLVKSPKEILQVVSSVLTKYALQLEDAAAPRLDKIATDSDDDSDDENEDDDIQEMASMCLSLVSGIGPEISGEDQPLLLALKPQLVAISDKAPNQLAIKAQTAMEFSGVGTSTSNTLGKALAALQEPMVPVRAHGLHQIRELIKTRDPSLSVDQALRILQSQLKDEDSFIYLNSIKALQELSDLHGAKLIVPKLLSFYTTGPMDDRLKAGEVLLRIVQRLDKAFVGEVADSIVNTMVSKVGLTNDEEPLRNSALSILGAICEVNPQELSQAQLIDALDCAIGVLTFEQSAPMRSAAVVLIGSLVLGISSLNEIPKRFVQQIMNRLTTASTDNDSLVRVQATTTLDRIRDKLSYTI